MGTDHYTRLRRGTRTCLPGTALSLSMVGSGSGQAASSTGLLPAQSQLSIGNSAAALQATITDLGRSFEGDIGIAVQDIETGHVAEFDGRTFFPQQSVSKFWVALAALDAADRGAADLGAPVALKTSDLPLFHQPIAKDIRSSGTYRTTLGDLLTRG